MREITSLKASVEPMLIRPRRQAIVVVKVTEAVGMEVRGLTWCVLGRLVESGIFLCCSLFFWALLLKKKKKKENEEVH